MLKMTHPSKTYDSCWMNQKDVAQAIFLPFHPAMYSVCPTNLYQALTGYKAGFWGEHRMEKVPLDTLMRVTVSERKHDIHESQMVIFLKGTTFNGGCTSVTAAG